MWPLNRDPTALTLAVVLAISLSVFSLVLLGRKHKLAGIACLAFTLRGIRGVMSQIMQSELDGGAYNNFAVSLVRHWQGQGPDPGAWLGKDGFPALLAAIYTVIGEAPEIGYLINAFAGGLSVIVVGATTAQMGWDRAIRPSAWLVALWPVGVVWGGMLLREAIVTLLLSIALWGAVRLYKQHWLSGVVAVLGTGTAMLMMRGGLAYLVLIGLPITVVLASNLRRKPGAARWVFAISVVAMSTFLLSLLSDYFEGSQYFEYRGEVVRETNNGSSSFSQAGAAAASLDTSVIGHLLRIPLTALGPLPWQVTNLSLAIAAIDAALWLAAWAFAIYATRFLRPRAEGLLFMLPTLALVVALAANAANFGLIIRLRGQGIVFLAPLAALGLVLWHERRLAAKAAHQEVLNATRERGRARARSTGR